MRQSTVPALGKEPAGGEGRFGRCQPHYIIAVGPAVSAAPCTVLLGFGLLCGASRLPRRPLLCGARGQHLAVCGCRSRGRGSQFASGSVLVLSGRAGFPGCPCSPLLCALFFDVCCVGSVLHAQSQACSCCCRRLAYGVPTDQPPAHHCLPVYVLLRCAVGRAYPCGYGVVG